MLVKNKIYFHLISIITTFNKYQKLYRNTLNHVKLLINNEKIYKYVKYQILIHPNGNKISSFFIHLKEYIK